MKEQHLRTAALLGESAIQKLNSARVIVFGVGGVGSYTVEALARAGVGSITLVDADTVAPSNINRQLIALHSTIGQDKVMVAQGRILDINPEAKVTTKKQFVMPEDIPAILAEGFDYVIDAIDSVKTKVALAVYCEKNKIPLISCMGTGNKIDPTKFELSDIYKTSVCPLARAVRAELKKRGVKHLKVLYSKEVPELRGEMTERGPASCSFVPSVAGLIIAGEVIKALSR